jgi:hypothetical protein
MASTNVSSRQNVNDNMGYSKNKRRRLEMYVTSALVELNLDVEFHIEHGYIEGETFVEVCFNKEQFLDIQEEKSNQVDDALEEVADELDGFVTWKNDYTVKISVE